MYKVLVAAVFTAAAAHSAEPAKTYENLDAVLWTQASVEYQANALQAYRTARVNLLEALEDKHWTAALEQTGNFAGLPPAVILDLDETVLDNSAFNAGMVARGEKYTGAGWDAWVKQARALQVPGAVEFLNFAQVHGVALIYITNRVCDASDPNDPTVQVLRNLRAPLAIPQGRLLCKDSTAENPEDKTMRRSRVASAYRVLLLIGDNFYDFIPQPKPGLTSEQRVQALRVYSSFFGERWIILPNPIYGSWEGPIGRTLDQKLKALRQ